MSDFGGGGDVQVSAVADEASLNALAAAVENAIAKGFEKGFKGLGVGLDRQTKVITQSMSAAMEKGFKQGFVGLEKAISRLANGRGLKDLEGAIKDAFTGGNTKDLLADMSKVDKQFLSLTARLKALDAAVSVQSAAVAAAGLNNAKAAIQNNIEIAKAADRSNQAQKAADRARIISLNASLQERLVATKQAGAAELTSQRAALDAVGREQKQAGELAVISARNSGRLRVAAARAAFEGILAVERGLGTAIQGIARTATSGFSKVFAGLSSALRRSNTEFVDGVSTNLNRREKLLRESFSSQERIVRNSVLTQEKILTSSQIRQQAAITNARGLANTGVVGAANRSGLFGGLLAGAGVIAGIKSTFNVGGEFTRGLAVLQAQLGLTGDQIQSVRDLSIALGNDISLPGVSALDAAQAIQILTKQFGSLGPAAVEAAEAAAKGTLQLARAASVGAEEAGGLIGSAVNVFGVGAEKAVEVADLITGALTKAAGVSFGDFSDAFKQGAAVFAQFQVPAVGATEALVDFNTALTVIARGGVVGSDAGTSLKQFFLQANRGTDDANAALAALTERAGETGTAFFEASGNARPFADTLDILRRGLDGYTDEQRAAALQTIFGSDAIRVANALLSVSTEEYAAVEEGIRKQGLAAKIAAAQNTGLKGALDAMSSIIETVQILLYEMVQGPLASFVLEIANLTNNILFGEGAFAVLRQGLLGAASGLAAILAAKGAVEVLQLLKVAATLLLTPFGALVAAAAGIGALLGIFIPRSEALREALRSGRDAVVDFAGSARDFLVPVIERVVEFITDTGIPAFLRLADTVRGYLVEGFGIAARFITGTVVPALQTAFVATAGFITDTALPAIRSFIDYLGDEVAPKLLTAAEAVGRFFVRVRDAVGDSGLAAIAAGLAGLALGGPIIGAAAAGLAFIGTRITETFTGFDDIGTTALNALKGLGSNIVKFLEPARKQIVEFFGNLFSIDTLESVGDGVLTAVRFIGEKLGEVLSSKNFVRIVSLAAAGIVAAAALLGFNFLKGFVQGVQENAPEMLRYVRDAIIDGLKLLLNPEIIGALLIGVFALAGVFRPIATAFQSLGRTAGESFTGAFKARISSGAGFVEGLLGPDVVNARNAKRGDKQLLKDFQAVNNELRIMGSTKVGTLGLEAAQAEAHKLRDGLSASQYAGLKLRDTAHLAGLAIKTTFAGAKGIVSGFGQSFAALGSALLTPFSSGDFKTKFTGGLSQVKNSFKATFAELSLIAREQGTSIGKVFGAGMAVAIGGSLAGFVGGKAEGRAGGSGGLSAITAALTTGLLVTQATGGNVVAGAAAGAIAGGVALIGTEMGKSARAAEIFADGVRDAAGVIKGAFADALADGTAGVISLTDAFGNSDVAQSILEGFTPATLKVLREAGITIDQITKAFAGGDTSARDFISQLGTVDVADGFSKTEAAIVELNAAYAETKAGIDAVNDSAAVAGRTIKDSLNPQAIAALRAANADLLNPQAQAAARARAPGVTRPTITGARDAPFNIPTPTISSAALTNASGEIDKALGQLELQAQQTNQKIQELFNPSVANQELFTAIDQAVISISGLGVQVQEQSKIAAEAAGTGVATVAEAQINEFKRQFGTEFADIIQTGIAEGKITDAATAQYLTRPLLDAALAGVTDPAIIAAFTDLWITGTTNLPPIITETNATTSATAAASAIRTYFTNNPIDPELATDKSLGDYTAAATAYFTAHPIQPGVEANTEEARLAAEALVATMKGVLSGNTFARIAGNQIGQGLIDGLNAKADAVAISASALARKAADAMAAALGIASPSKVAMRLGGFVGEGLALGISSQLDYVGFAADSLGQSIGQRISDALQDSTNGITGILTGVLDEAFSSATSTISKQNSAVAAGLAGLFGGVAGSGQLGALGLVPFGASGQALGGITTSLQGVMTALEGSVSNFNQIQEQLKEGKTPLLASQQRLANANPFSLGPSDPFGVSNLSALTGAFDAIVEYGKILLAQGNSAQSVADVVAQRTQDLIGLATGIGFAGDEVNQIAVAMGLSGDALAGFVATASEASYQFAQAQYKAQQLAIAEEKAANSAAALELAAEFTAAEFANLSEEAKQAAIKTAGFSAAIDTATAAQMAILAAIGLGPAGAPANPTGGGAFDPDRAFPDDPRNPKPGDSTDIEKVLAALPRPITNIIQLPYGDPMAVALAVTNRIVEAASTG